MVARLLWQPALNTFDQWCALKARIRIVLHGVAWYGAVHVKEFQAYILHCKVHLMKVAVNVLSC